MTKPCAVLLSICLSLIASIRASAGQGTPQQLPNTPVPGLSQGLDPGTTVPLDLTRGRFLAPLPFDVQFYVQSPIKDTVTSVTGRYASNCSDALNPASTRGINMGRGILLPATGTPPLRSVELSIPPLTPNRRYCFAFTLTLKPDDDALRAIVARELNLQLQNLFGNEQSLTNGTAFDDFRVAVLSAIQDAAAELQLETGLSLRLTVPNDSFFALPPTGAGATPATAGDARPTFQTRPGVASTSINLKEREEFARLLSSQLGKANAVTTFNNRVSLATNELARLRAMVPFQHTLAQLRANMAQPLVRQRLPTEALLGFATSAPELDEAQASGLLVSEIGAATNVARAWEPSDLDSRVTNLDATIGQLEGFRELVTDLSTASWQPLRDVAGLGPQVAGLRNPNVVQPEEFIAVAQQVERVRQALLEGRGALTNMQRMLTDRSRLIAAAANRITADIVEVIQIDGDTTANWDVRARSYISADVGVAWSNPIDQFFFYLGANFYLGPVNKRAPLRWSDPGNFRKRFSFTVGIPINTISDTQSRTTLTAGDVTLTGVLGDRPLLVGAGLRLNDLVRVSSGVVLFRVVNPNPLITRERLDYSWFLAFSIDWDLRGMFAQMGQSAARASRPHVGF
jgi:hypothetical protein